ncbi:MAG: hypothetical protein KDD40_11185, partial [Bdellovibrionales bacterium]|nr:hypothetical protein [Bdellovibrionales bacterium]
FLAISVRADFDINDFPLSNKQLNTQSNSSLPRNLIELEKTLSRQILEHESTAAAQRIMISDIMHKLIGHSLFKLNLISIGDQSVNFWFLNTIGLHIVCELNVVVERETNKYNVQCVDGEANTRLKIIKDSIVTHQINALLAVTSDNDEYLGNLIILNNYAVIDNAKSSLEWRIKNFLYNSGLIDGQYNVRLQIFDRSNHQNKNFYFNLKDPNGHLNKCIILQDEILKLACIDAQDTDKLTYLAIFENSNSFHEKINLITKQSL